MLGPTTYVQHGGWGIAQCLDSNRPLMTADVDKQRLRVKESDFLQCSREMAETLNAISQIGLRTSFDLPTCPSKSGELLQPSNRNLLFSDFKGPKIGTSIFY